MRDVNDKMSYSVNVTGWVIIKPVMNNLTRRSVGQLILSVSSLFSSAEFCSKRIPNLCSSVCHR